MKQKIHPLMLAAVIAFWGWQTEQWLVAAPVAAMVCASFYVPLRWALTTAHLIRVADFCMVLGLLTGVLLYVNYGIPIAVVVFFKWLPMLLWPVALAHAYSTAERMEMRVLFWSLRRRPREHVNTRAESFDPWWPYYALWIVAASTANNRDAWFYIGLIALASWPLVRIRPWSYRVGTWGVAFSLAVALGFGLHYGLNTAQGWLENAVPDWLSSDGSRTDPYRATTDIGHIGKLKDSDAIVLRVTTPDGAYGTKAPALLHRASYNTYFGAAWLARNATFAPLQSTAPTRWPLVSTAPDHMATARVTIHDYSERPNPVLSLPAGTSAIENLNAITVQRNALGAVQIVREPGYFSYAAAYSSETAGEAALDAAPTADDLRLPAKEREAYAAVAAELGLSAQAAASSAERVKYFFAHGYQYATFQKDAAIAGSPMVDFLHRSKSGHCEYFATATALLLRAGGIPARYATGFAVSEKSALENAYIVRQRHAHAWVRAYVNGAWIDIDTTPPSWVAAEAEGSGWWTVITDHGSWLRFRASRAWANSDQRQWIAGALVIVFPFAAWLAWRLYRSRRRATKND
jgi:hypothetical protein